MTGEVLAVGAEAVGTWLGTSAGTAALTAAGTAVVGAGASKLLAPSGHGITIPPPPGAAMIDPAGAQAASMERQRQADAGGIKSTESGAGANAAGYTSATAGTKGLLGQ